jgi:hypothetical protein
LFRSAAGILNRTQAVRWANLTPAPSSFRLISGSPCSAAISSMASAERLSRWMVAAHGLAGRVPALPLELKDVRDGGLVVGEVKIGAKAVAHAKYLTFHLAEVAIPRKLFARILKRIARLRPARASG